MAGEISQGDFQSSISDNIAIVGETMAQTGSGIELVEMTIIELAATGNESYVMKIYNPGYGMAQGQQLPEED